MLPLNDFLLQDVSISELATEMKGTDTEPLSYLFKQNYSTKQCDSSRKFGDKEERVDITL